MRQDNVLVFQSLAGAARFLASVSVFLSWNEDSCQLQVTFVGDIVQLKHGKSQIWMINGTEIELFAQQWSSGTWNPNGWNPFCSRGFCDVKFQNWLFATPISGPPRSGAVKRQWQVLVLACLEDRPREFGLLWCSSISHLGLSTLEVTCGPLHTLWRIAQFPTRDQEAKQQDLRDWENLRTVPHRSFVASCHPSCSLGSPHDGAMWAPAASAMLLHSFPRGRRGLGGRCRDVWGGLSALLPSPQGPIPPGSTGTGRAPGFPGFLQMVSPSWCLHQPLPTWSVCCGELGLLGRSQSTGCLWKPSPSKNNCRLQWFPQVTTKECPCVSLGLCALFRAFFGWTRSLQVASMAAEEQWRACWRSYLWAPGRSICGRWPCWLRCVILPFWSWFKLLEGSWYWDRLLLWFCEVLYVGEENVLSI